MGPTEYLVIGFEGNKFNGDIMPELKRLCDERVIRVIDLLIVMREGSDELISMELDDIPDMQEYASYLDGDLGQWFSQDDIDQIGEVIPADSTVALVLVEHLWAKPLADAIARANGALMAQTHVPRELMDEVETLIGAGTPSDNMRYMPENLTDYERRAA